MGVSSSLFAQHHALSTNLAYDATLSPNLALELRLSPSWSARVGAGLQAWDLDSRPAHNKKLRHLLVGAGLRRYHGLKRDTLRSDIRQSGAFPQSSGIVSQQSGLVPQSSGAVPRQVGDTVVTRRYRYFEPNVLYSHYNVGGIKFPFGLYGGVKDRRLQGDLMALGAKYGYGWMLSRSWAVEAEAGVAVGYAWFKEYDCPHCGSYLGKDDRIFLLPQLGINVVYIIN